jgi:ethanolamine utilization protein EutP (predicted NTPase)
VVVLTKTDLLSPEEVETRVAELAQASGKPVFPVSIIDEPALKAFADALVAEIKSVREA